MFGSFTELFNCDTVALESRFAKTHSTISPAIIVFLLTILFFPEFIPAQAGSLRVTKTRTFMGCWWETFFTGQMPFLSPTQQCQGTEGCTLNMSVLSFHNLKILNVLQYKTLAHHANLHECRSKIKKINSRNHYRSKWSRPVSTESYL